MLFKKGWSPNEYDATLWFYKCFQLYFYILISTDFFSLQCYFHQIILHTSKLSSVSMVTDVWHPSCFCSLNQESFLSQINQIKTAFNDERDQYEKRIQVLQDELEDQTQHHLQEKMKLTEQSHLQENRQKESLERQLVEARQQQQAHQSHLAETRLLKAQQHRLEENYGKRLDDLELSNGRLQRERDRVFDFSPNVECVAVITWSILLNILKTPLNL